MSGLFSGWRRLDGPEFHVIISLVLVVGAMFLGLPPLAAAIATVIGWTALEVWQGVRDGKGPYPRAWGWRKRMEWLTPIAVGLAAAAVYCWVAP